jgi:oxygen-independent coproporphyrinogen-3 oxidase
MKSQDWIAQARSDMRAMGVADIQASGILPEGGKKFFPVIGYPPLTMFSDMDETPLFRNFYQRPASPTLGYAHIPFCPSRCTFCHWITKTKSKSEEVDVYLDYLEREMILYKTKMGVDAIPVQSVLIGGGTPTYLNPRQMERFLKMFTTHYDTSACTQFSVEAEPGTLLGDEGLAKLKLMKDYGVHRISLGVQSFDDAVLAQMGRVHNHADTLHSIEQMRSAGIENVFIDLIYAYPNQTLEMWVDNMLECVRMGIEGYQLYRLRIRQHGDRPGNIIKVADKNPDYFPDTDETLLMKYLGILISQEHGYKEYQTRCFARKPDDISHYLRDWAAGLADVAGVGVSSWSNLRGVFSMNVGDQSLASYYSLIDQGKVPVNRGKIRSHDDQVRRSFILPLKNMKVEKQLFTERTGETINGYFADEVRWLKQLGLLAEDHYAVWLTKTGRFFADEVATQFFDPHYLPFPDVARPPKPSSLSGRKESATA